MPKSQCSNEELSPDANLGDLIPQPKIVPLTIDEREHRKGLLDKLSDALRRWGQTSEFKL